MVAGFNFSAAPFSPVVVSNRGPFEVSPDGQVRRGSGGLVTAVSTLVDRTRAPWIACARTEAERTLARMSFSDLGDGHRTVGVHYVDSDPETYRKHLLGGKSPSARTRSTFALLHPFRKQIVTGACIREDRRRQLKRSSATASTAAVIGG
jgi:hypothetical protein